MLLAAADPLNLRDVFETLTYLLVILFSAFAMVAWLKIKAKRKRK